MQQGRVRAEMLRRVEPCLAVGPPPPSSTLPAPFPYTPRASLRYRLLKLESRFQMVEESAAARRPRVGPNCLPPQRGARLGAVRRRRQGTERGRADISAEHAEPWRRAAGGCHGLPPRSRVPSHRGGEGLGPRRLRRPVTGPAGEGRGKGGAGSDQLLGPRGPLTGSRNHCLPPPKRPNPTGGRPAACLLTSCFTCRASYNRHRPLGHGVRYTWKL